MTVIFPEIQDPDAITAWLKTDYFREWRKGLGHVESITAEIDICLSEYDTTNPVIWVAWANHLAHHSGKIIQSYGYKFGVTPELIQAISEGMDKVFADLDKVQ